MNIKVDVNLKAPELAQSINRLAEILPNLVIAQDILNVEEKVGETEPTPKEDSKKPTKKASKGTTEKEEVVKPKEPESKSITLEEVRATLASLSQDGKQAQVKELITQFGAKKLSDIPVEKYAELLERAEGL
jgi:hypothetical protein